MLNIQHNSRQERQTSLSLIASINIKFGNKQTIHDMIAPLLNAGWMFGKNTITYDYYKPVWKIGSNEQQGSLDQWKQISDLLTAKVQGRHTARLEMYFPEGGFVGVIFFRSLREMRFAFFGSQPRLSGCHRYTSYTPLLESIVCPLADAGLPVIEVRCQDDNC